ncbi:hypothetical protein V1478_005633 [Vespula squamosa]|uniref:Uncharacterized protein n=1 Tax=Vespula squamosa TaxID=30214 RepID=A0ABD2BAB6_VESSQ
MATDWTTNTFGPILVLKIYTLGIDSLVNRILFFRRYTLSSQFCELKSPLSLRFYTTLFHRKIVTISLKAITWSKRLLGFLDLTYFITDLHYVLTLRYGEHAHVYDTDEICGVPNEAATFGKIFGRKRKRSHHP